MYPGGRRPAAERVTTMAPTWRHDEDDDEIDLPQEIDLADDDSGDEADMVCPACGRAVWPGTEKCPHCGDWIRPTYARHWRWKHTVFLVAVALMLLAMIRFAL